MVNFCHSWEFPCFLYWLEVQLLTNNDIKNFKTLPTCLAFLGILPIEAILHKNLLNMFVNMIRNEDSIECKLAQAQLIVRESTKESIFIHIQLILTQFGLPSIFEVELLKNPPAKEDWKCTKYMTR